MKSKNLPMRPHSVVIILNNEKKFLLVRCSSSPGCWSFVSETIEPGESPEAAAVRGVKEETGINVDLLARSSYTPEHPWTPEYVKSKHFRWSGDRFTIFLAQFLGDDSEIILDKQEVLAYKWINQEDFSRDILSEKMTDIFKKTAAEFAKCM